MATGEGNADRSLDLKALLPLYLNGVLVSGDAKELEARLAQDPELQKELAELAELRDLLQGARRDWPEPSTDLFQRIRQGIDEQQNQASESLVEHAFQRLTQAVLSAWGSPGLAWGLAGVLLLLCIGLGLAVHQETRYLTLTGQQVAERDGVVVQAVFQGEARLEEVQVLLKDIGATIIGGPYRDGLYVLMVPSRGIDSVLERARQSPLVRYIQPALPGRDDGQSEAQPEGGADR